MPKRATPVTDAAVKKATGRTLRQWFTFLDEKGADKMQRRDIANMLFDERHIMSAWWCQTVTVEYEKARKEQDVK